VLFFPFLSHLHRCCVHTKVCHQLIWEHG
jgi:hypothetical protein